MATVSPAMRSAMNCWRVYPRSVVRSLGLNVGEFAVIGVLARMARLSEGRAICLLRALRVVRAGGGAGIISAGVGLQLK